MVPCSVRVAVGGTQRYPLGREGRASTLDERGLHLSGTGPAENAEPESDL